MRKKHRSIPSIRTAFGVGRQEPCDKAVLVSAAEEAFFFPVDENKKRTTTFAEACGIGTPRRKGIDAFWMYVQDLSRERISEVIHYSAAVTLAGPLSIGRSIRAR